MIVKIAAKIIDNWHGLTVLMIWLIGLNVTFHGFNERFRACVKELFQFLR